MEEKLSASKMDMVFNKNIQGILGEEVENDIEDDISGKNNLTKANSSIGENMDSIMNILKDTSIDYEIARYI